MESLEEVTEQLKSRQLPTPSITVGLRKAGIVCLLFSCNFELPQYSEILWIKVLYIFRVYIYRGHALESILPTFVEFGRRMCVRFLLIFIFVISVGVIYTSIVYV